METIESDGFGIGLRAFAGLEYFFLPKVSVGREFGLVYTHYFGGKRTTTQEYWDFATDQVETEMSEVITNYSLTLSDISNGRIILLFHF